MKPCYETVKNAAEPANDDPAALKDIPYYYASSQQLKEAIPLYLRVLELQPKDANAREKMATGFILTNQRDKAIEMLEQIIKEHPDKYQPYDLLAQVLDDEARSLQRANRIEEAKATFAKVAANYEQSLLINPNHPGTYLHLAELLLGPLKNAARGVQLLAEARHRFPGAPEIVYYLAIAQREAKQSQQAVATFEEALHEAQLDEEHDEPVSFEHIGDTYLKLNRVPEALESWQKALALDPKNKNLAEKIERTKKTIGKDLPVKTNPT